MSIICAQSLITSCKDAASQCRHIDDRARLVVDEIPVPGFHVAPPGAGVHDPVFKLSEVQGKTQPRKSSELSGKA